MKLLPCPFCGSVPQVREGNDPPYFVAIECTECGVNLTVWKKEKNYLYNYPISNVPKRYIRDLWNRKSRKGGYILKNCISFNEESLMTDVPIVVGLRYDFTK